MKRILTVFLLIVTLFYAASAVAKHAHYHKYHWYRAVNVTHVTMKINVVTEAEIRFIIKKYSKQRIDYDFNSEAADYAYGFAVLFRNRVTGAYMCQIYLTDATDKATLAHEKRHCYGWEHREL